jgi:hypothetical protein
MASTVSFVFLRRRDEDGMFEVPGRRRPLPSLRAAKTVARAKGPLKQRVVGGWLMYERVPRRSS